MSSLLLTIIAMALTVSVTGATMFYVSSSMAKAELDVAAATVLAQGEQMGAAIQVRSLKKPDFLYSIYELKVENYLSELPLAPRNAYVVGISPKESDWQVVQPAPRPLIVIKDKIREEVCLAFNKHSFGDYVVRAAPDAHQVAQCFGETEPFTIAINQSGNADVVQKAINYWNYKLNEGSVVPEYSNQINTPKLNGGRIVTSGALNLNYVDQLNWTLGVSVNYDLKTLLRPRAGFEFEVNELTWLIEGKLPKGIVLNPNNGILSGIPLEEATYNFTVKANYNDVVAQQIFQIKVSAPGFLASSISSGYNHSCAVSLEGAAYCWGSNTSGQLGSSTTAGSSIPLAVVGLGKDVKSVSVGFNYSCALMIDGQVRCWGQNQYGQLGLGNVGSSVLTPAPVLGLSGVTDIQTAFSHTCATTQTGALYCWGRNAYGEVGNGSTTLQPKPAQVLALNEPVTSMALGQVHTCVTMLRGSVYCWGHNAYSQLGLDDTANRLSATKLTSPGESATQVTAKEFHTCALSSSGTVSCWGWNGNGQLGTGNTTPQRVPAQVPGLTHIVALSAGAQHVCGISNLNQVGQVLCWGGNAYGQVVASAPASVTQPVPAAGLTVPITSISSGYYHTCAIDIYGVSRCWGYNGSGALGDGSTTSRASAKEVFVFR